jgi:alpha-L-fucosidase
MEAVMAALRKLQQRWDDMLPEEDDGHQEAVNDWLAHSAEQLVRYGDDILFTREGKDEQGVTHAEYLTALQDYLNQRQKDGEDKEDLFAQLVLSNAYGSASATTAGYLIGTISPRGKLLEIAEALLKPFADDALIAKAEEAL